MVPPLNNDTSGVVPMTVSTSHVNVEESSVSMTTMGSALLLNTKNHHDNNQYQEDNDLQVSFSHVQLYVDHVKDLQVYKQLEHVLNHYAKQVQPDMTLSDKQQLYQSLLGNDRNPSTTSAFVPQNRDVIEQLIAGFGFRITACRYPLLEPMTSNENSHYTTNTRSVLVTSKDGMGAQFVITALIDNDQNDNTDATEAETQDPYHHFDASNLHRFGAVHANRQGIAVMGFAVNHVDQIRQRYQRLHPKLIHNYSEYQGDGNGDGTVVKILEVFAYYDNSSMDSATPSSMETEADGDVEVGQHGAHLEKPQADLGTLLRFVQRYPPAKEGGTSSTTWLPGLTPVEAIFDEESQPVYCDHWVSNVISRTGFLQTLEDTLGFTPKVDFNAGVVAAGEAQIESTVTGNNSTRRMADKRDALRDQSQVYLPINNALSEVGHVHGFLKEIGQGIQHVASRVENLVDFVQRGNDNRKITGEGFSFLNIPRSYYGVLSAQNLVEEVGLSMEDVNGVLSACTMANVTTSDGAVDLTLTRDSIAQSLDRVITRENFCFDEYQTHKNAILNTILFSRYRNLHSLLQNQVSEETYIGIVSNQILVDVQREDLLYQIFTCNILQRNAGEEAPFFEFIQRVCSECKDENGCPVTVKPGCGGFGIRNFLTLFLSIEVSKSMLDLSAAKACGDKALVMYSQKRVDCFTAQLNESNPILTEISNAMTEEGLCQEQLKLVRACVAKTDDADSSAEEAVAQWTARMEAAKQRKLEGNRTLMECSARYEKLMRSIREAGT